jgi:two-component system sensor histidine kinase ChvG
LISDISDASRLDAELSRTKFDLVDMGAMLATIVDMHNDYNAGSPKVRLEHIDGDKGSLMMAGMDGRLAQVFQNLITNALSFSPKQGRITLVVVQTGSEICIYVDDEGPGIPTGLEQKIFERFYTERPDSEKFGTHSGLGLNISKQIVEAHEGSIIASNRTNIDGEVVGARFSVSFPKAEI